MEQVSFFWAEYSDWISVWFGVLVTLLLTVTLHRIKKLGKRMDTLVRSFRSSREAWAEFDEMANWEHTDKEKTTDLKMTKQKKTEGGALMSRQNAGKEIPGEWKQQMDPDELLNAVLEEVFL